jgi:hypothetical protein
MSKRLREVLKSALRSLHSAIPPSPDYSWYEETR